MAQLYLEQGHLESALDIYRKLVAQRPDDEDLAARMDAIEERLAVSSVAPARSFGGPTIREFLSGLVNRVPWQTAAPAPETVDARQTIDESFDAVGDTLQGDIDTPLDDFGDLDGGFQDASDAAPLASGPALEGEPAHRAPDELSLDHVFKGNSAPRPAGEGDGFSFDQFFSDEVAEDAVENSADSSAVAQQGPDDIAQFNAWLNGLKKT